MHNTWLISDPHLDHANIIQYCNRPFTSVKEMNEVILQNWYELVKDNDLVYLLGDIGFNCRWWLRQLTGHIMLVKGSHDNGLRAPYHRLLHIDNKDILLIHNPAYKPVWWTSWVIHGHLHNKAPLIDYKTKQVNVSVEVTHYKPISLACILELIAEGKSKP